MYGKKYYVKVFGILILTAILSLNTSHKIVASSGSSSEKPQNKPNIILITINVFRADHVSAYGYHRKTTPAIDEIASDSMVFKNAFAQAGYTFPNMISIMTSLYPDSHQVLDVFKDKLSTQVKTLAEILNIHGYKTAWIAPLDEPHLELEAGVGRGFQDKAHIDLQLNGKEQINDWISSHKNQSFFLATNFRHTHTPYLPLPNYRNRFNQGQRGNIPDNQEDLDIAFVRHTLEEVKIPGSESSKVYDKDMIARHPEIFNNDYERSKVYKLEKILPPEERYKAGNLEVIFYNSLIDPSDNDNVDYLVSLYDSCLLGTDQEIIRPLVNLLKNEDLYENTMIIVTADHGESHGEHGVFGHGLEFYDQLIHVPLIIKLPGQKEQQIRQEPAMSIDILPTILEITNISMPFYIQGKSLLNVRDNIDLSRGVYGQNRQFSYLRTLDWKLIFNRDKQKHPKVKNRLFNIKTDPDELAEVNEQFPDIYNAMHMKLLDHLNTLPKFRDEDYQFAPHLDDEARENIKETGYW